MRITEWATAHDLAVEYGIGHWPAPCPLCGDTTHYGRKLQSEPGINGAARYFCGNCRTTFSRRRGLVAQYAKRTR